MLAVTSWVVERHMEECWMANVILFEGWLMLSCPLLKSLKQRFELSRAEKLTEKKYVVQLVVARVNICL